MNTLQDVLTDLTHKGVCINLDPYFEYKKSPSPNPKILTQMEGLEKYTVRTTQRVYPLFKVIAPSGRISCRMPNLIALQPLAKEMVVPDPGQYMLEMYFKYAEAHAAQVLSGDSDFKDLLALGDVHQEVATRLGLLNGSENPVQYKIGRTLAKRVFFAALYKGPMGTFPEAILRESPEVPKLVRAYLDMFPTLRNWLDTTDQPYQKTMTLVSETLNECLIRVHAELQGTGARVLFPSMDGMHLSCPANVGIDEVVNQKIEGACNNNVLQAPLKLVAMSNYAG